MFPQLAIGAVKTRRASLNNSGGVALSSIAVSGASSGGYTTSSYTASGGVQLASPSIVGVGLTVAATNTLLAKAIAYWNLNTGTDIYGDVNGNTEYIESYTNDQISNNATTRIYYGENISNSIWGAANYGAGIIGGSVLARGGSYSLSGSIVTAKGGVLSTFSLYISSFIGFSFWVEYNGEFGFNALNMDNVPPAFQTKVRLQTGYIRLSSKASSSADTWDIYDYGLVTGFNLVICEFNTATNQMSLQVNDGSIQTQYFESPLNPLSSFSVYKIDELAVYDTALTTDERTALWNSGAGITYPFN